MSLRMAWRVCSDRGTYVGAVWEFSAVMSRQLNGFVLPSSFTLFCTERATLTNRRFSGRTRYSAFIGSQIRHTCDPLASPPLAGVSVVGTCSKNWISVHRTHPTSSKNWISVHRTHPTSRPSTSLLDIPIADRVYSLVFAEPFIYPLLQAFVIYADQATCLCLRKPRLLYC
jgi:hypothetical protein